MLRMTLASLIIGGVIGTTIAAVRISHSNEAFKVNCAANHGTVSYHLRWEHGPILMTNCTLRSARR